MAEYETTPLKHSATAVPMASAGGAFAVINSAGLLVTTVLGAWATLYSDLFPGSTLGQQKAALAVGWVACIFLTLLILGYHDKADSGNPWQRIAWGVRLLRRNAGYAFMVLFMASAAAFCAYGKLTSTPEQAGVLKTLVATADRLERVAQQTRDSAQRAATAAESTGRKADTLIERTARIENKLNQALTPREELAKQGISWDGPSFSQALVTGDARVVELFLKGGLNARTASAPPGEGGNALGQFIALAPATNTAATVKILRLLAGKLDVTQPIAQFRGVPPMNLLSLALYACNLRMAQSHAAAGLDMQKLNRPTIEGHLGPLTIDPVARLVNWKASNEIEGRSCSEPDRQQLLKMVSGASFR
jgi:hypothetical protein